MVIRLFRSKRETTTDSTRFSTYLSLNASIAKRFPYGSMKGLSILNLPKLHPRILSCLQTSEGTTSRQVPFSILRQELLPRSCV